MSLEATEVVDPVTHDGTMSLEATEGVDSKDLVTYGRSSHSLRISKLNALMQDMDFQATVEPST